MAQFLQICCIQSLLDQIEIEKAGLQKRIRMEKIEQCVIDAITRFRKENRITQKELGQIMQVSSSFIGNVETVKNPAKYNLKHIGLLAEYFKISPALFFIRSKSEIPDITQIF